MCLYRSSETGTFYNSVDATANARQSQTEIGTPNNFAFTFQLNRNESQKTVNNSIVTFAALDTTSTSNASSSKTSISRVEKAGQQVNGVPILSNVDVFQSVVSLVSQDGSSTSPQGQSTGHFRWSNTVVVWLQGNSVAGKGRQTTMVWSSVWGNSASTGPWGNQAGMGSTLSPVDLSWPVKSPMPPPPPPPPQPVSMLNC
jgi:hypothetical protein